MEGGPGQNLSAGELGTTMASARCCASMMALIRRSAAHVPPVSWSSVVL